MQAYFYDVKEDATFAQLPFCAGGTDSPGRHCHSTLSLSASDSQSLGMYTVILRSLLPFFVEMTSAALG